MIEHGAALFGRQEATRALGALVEGVRAEGGAVLVRGEAGIGKSAVLAWTAGRAADAGLRVLSTTGVESEAQVAFAGLHQLLAPVLGQVDPLPDALLAAFGRADVAAVDPSRLALATLDLLGELAAEQPVLLVVEDVHWLDRASADALAFVARRLAFEPIVLVVAARDGFHGPFDDLGLAEVRLGPLGRADAAALLEARAPQLGAAVRERVLDEAAGNPLALVELPAVVDAGPVGVVALLSLTARLERAFAARVTGLPTATRSLLLVAALNDGPALAEALAAAPETVEEDLRPAVDAELVEVSDGSIRFRHPLMRSAIHQRASPDERRAAHLALAGVVAGDPERRPWHRASAARGPDEDVAADLEAAAARAHQRGGIETAAAALERAAGLTADPDERAERLLRAADLVAELGRWTAVNDLLIRAGQGELSAEQRVRLRSIREVFDDGVGPVATGTTTLARLAEGVARAGRRELAVKLLANAASRCYFTQPGPEVREDVIAVAERIFDDECDPRLLGLLGFASPVERGAAILERLPVALEGIGGDPALTRQLGNAALSVGAYDVAVRLQGPGLVTARAQGRLATLARLVGARAWCTVNLGELSDAIPNAEEAVWLATETSQPNLRALARAHQASAAALQGDHDATERIAAEVEREALAVGARIILAGAQMARGLSALGDGRYAEAYEHLRRVYDPADPAHHLSLCYGLSSYVIEAAVRSGAAGEVRALMGELERRAAAVPSPALHIGLRHARALLADDEAPYLEALAADLADWPFARARVLLGYGEWLRRHRRVAEARTRLRAAREAFDRLGIGPWSDRARAELAASGERSLTRAPGVQDLLTPQELQIAQLAAAGLTNREIGQRLYLSHRTVSTHLQRIFPKVGVGTRAALRGVLGPSAQF
ncbi:ATP-binding protein [Dactylosporangium sp. CA-139114]|uniref:ATP-binding protein n=1 Tax=Dactylosporangium sp. CA-139114 TaxID=3239931 RepID=UPI003D97B23A